MPTAIRKADIEQALGLLHQYQSKLKNTEDEALRKAIERVIKVLESKLFNALLDIAQYYEEILKDVYKSPGQVEKQAAIIAKKWDLHNKAGLKAKPSSRSDEKASVRPVSDTDTLNDESSPLAGRAPYATSDQDASPSTESKSARYSSPNP